MRNAERFIEKKRTGDVISVEDCIKAINIAWGKEHVEDFEENEIPVIS